MSSAKDTGQSRGQNHQEQSRGQEAAAGSPSQRSHPDPARRGGTFVQQRRGQRCEVTKLEEKRVTGSGRVWGATEPDLLHGITKQFQPPRTHPEHQCWWGRAEIKTNHRIFWGKAFCCHLNHTQQSRAGFSSGMKGEFFSVSQVTTKWCHRQRWCLFSSPFHLSGISTLLDSLQSLCSDVRESLASQVQPESSLALETWCPSQ